MTPLFPGCPTADHCVSPRRLRSWMSVGGNLRAEGAPGRLPDAAPMRGTAASNTHQTTGHALFSNVYCLRGIGFSKSSQVILAQDLLALRYSSPPSPSPQSLHYC